MARNFLLLMLCFIAPLQARPFFCGKNLWKATSINDPCTKELQSLKIAYCNSSPLNGLSTEFIFTKEGVNLIIGLLWCPLLGELNATHTSISITPDGFAPHQFSAYRYLGNQKLRLSCPDTKSLLKMLLSGHSLQIKFGIYETTIDCTGFPACWTVSNPSNYFKLQ